MRPINKIIVHCSDTPKGKHFDKDDIYQWHVIENGWRDIGYHYIVLLDGTVQSGRDIAIAGAHTKGKNRDSIGICYIGGKGGDTRTDQQKEKLKSIIDNLKMQFPKAVVYGHCDFDKRKKYCPGFDAKNEYL